MIHLQMRAAAMLALLLAVGCDDPLGAGVGDAAIGGDAAPGGDGAPAPDDGPPDDAAPAPDDAAPAPGDGAPVPDDAAPDDAAPAPGPDAYPPDDGAPPRPDAGGPTTTGRMVGYFPGWAVYARDFHVPEIPADRLTHINYAFANISAAGECELGDAYADTERLYPGDTWDEPLRGSFGQLLELKAAHPQLRTLISVGGWTWSERFSALARTAEGRERFARSCADFMERYGFDGIDVDWEYPVSGGLYQGAAEDRHNYTLLLQAMRRELEARGADDGRHYLLTIAAPAGPAIIANLEVPAIAAPLDWINVMTYDFMGAWSDRTGFNAPMRTTAGSGEPAGFAVTDAVDAYLEAGVPADKLVLGVPFYGRSFQGVGPTDEGVFQPHTGAGPGTWEAGVLDWEDIAANYLPRLTRRFSANAQSPWLYDPTARVLISYDDPESLAIKARFARERGLGGLMIWEMSADDDDHTLLDALR